jgi:hypothetical protein
MVRPVHHTTRIPIMTDYDWHPAPVCDAFAPTRYPPPTTVNPEHVGYAVQRYLPGHARGMGETLTGYWRLRAAEDLCRLLNADPSNPAVATKPRRQTYL